MAKQKETRMRDTNRRRLPPLDPRREYIGADEVVALLRDIERLRNRLASNAYILQHWLHGSEDLAKIWQAFTMQGGIGADDFEKFMAGTFRPCHPIRQCRHLRLLTGSQRRSARMHNGGPEAA
jgi:hypothetical protein